MFSRIRVKGNRPVLPKVGSAGSSGANAEKSSGSMSEEARASYFDSELVSRYTTIKMVSCGDSSSDCDSDCESKRVGDRHAAKMSPRRRNTDSDSDSDSDDMSPSKDDLSFNRPVKQPMGSFCGGGLMRYRSPAKKNTVGSVTDPEPGMCRHLSDSDVPCFEVAYPGGYGELCPQHLMFYWGYIPDMDDELVTDLNQHYVGMSHSELLHVSAAGRGSFCTHDGCTVRTKSKSGKCRDHNGTPCTQCVKGGGKVYYTKSKNGKCRIHRVARCTQDGCNTPTRRKNGKCQEHQPKCTECISLGAEDPKVVNRESGLCAHHRVPKCARDGCNIRTKGKSGFCPQHGGDGRGKYVDTDPYPKKGTEEEKAQWKARRMSQFKKRQLPVWTSATFVPKKGCRKSVAVRESTSNFGFKGARGDPDLKNKTVRVGTRYCGKLSSCKGLCAYHWKKTIIV